jgi:predicted nicotinamide N-methyase
LIPDIGDARILELGTGTGMVGLMCSELGAREVYMTDYHPSVLKNVARNIELNGCQNVQIHKLDFFEIAGLTPRTTPIENWENETFDIVIGSDLLYEMDHALSLPHVVSKFMKKAFHFLIPLRARYQEEVVTFESIMTELGFTAFVQEDLEYEEQEAQISQYRYYEWRR